MVTKARTAKYAQRRYELPGGLAVSVSDQFQYALIECTAGRAKVVKRSDSRGNIAWARGCQAPAPGPFYRTERDTGSVLLLDRSGYADADASYYVKRWTWTDCWCGSTAGECLHRPKCTPHPDRPFVVGRVTVGWVGPIRGALQAMREVASWSQDGQQARAYLATKERQREVDAWQRDADARHGRSVRR